MKPEDAFEATWPVALPHVKTLLTTRNGGVSLPPYASLNLGDHVGDAPQAVAANRALLAARVGLPFMYLQQVHGIAVLDLDQFEANRTPPVADAAVTSHANTPCVVMVADCLPLLLASVDGAVVAAVHCGWRSLAGGVVRATVQVMRTKLPVGVDIAAYLGPAIGPTAFEVGAEVKQQFAALDALNAAAFAPQGNAKYLANIYALVICELNKCAIQLITSEINCTVSNPARFFSYRRDGVCGRQAAVIWRQ